MPTDTFPLFTELPEELQLQVWSHALSSITIANSPWHYKFAFCTLLYERYVSGVSLSLGSDIYELKLEPAMFDFHAIMSTCRLSRQLGFEGLKRKFERDQEMTLMDEYLPGRDWKRPQLDEQSGIIEGIEGKLKAYR